MEKGNKQYGNKIKVSSCGSTNNGNNKGDNCNNNKYNNNEEHGGDNIPL